jgi:hypothetical protein
MSQVISLLAADSAKNLLSSDLLSHASPTLALEECGVPKPHGFGVPQVEFSSPIEAHGAPPCRAVRALRARTAAEFLLPSSSRLRLWQLLSRARTCQKVVLVLQAVGHVWHANILLALAVSNDAVVESDARCASGKLTNFERGRALLPHVKALAVAIRSQEHVIIHAGIDGFGKFGIQRDGCCSPGKMAGRQEAQRHVSERQI